MSAHRGPRFAREDIMHTVIKVILTATVLVLIAWPLMFWGSPAAPAREILRESAHVLRWAPVRGLEPDMVYSLTVW
jgi:hypothetical protein